MFPDLQMPSCIPLDFRYCANGAKPLGHVVEFGTNAPDESRPGSGSNGRGWGQCDSVRAHGRKTGLKPRRESGADHRMWGEITCEARFVDHKDGVPLVHQTLQQVK